MTGRKWQYVFAICIALAGIHRAEARKLPESPRIKLDHVPEIGEVLDERRLPRRSKFQCTVNSAQFDPCATALIGGVGYTITYRARESGAIKSHVVTRVATLDSRFKSPEGLRVGDTITLQGPEDITEAPYFEVYAKTASHWIPIIGMMGRVNLSFDGGKISGDRVETLWSLELKPVPVTITGFIEAGSLH